jgi:hypothetical protein
LAGGKGVAELLLKQFLHVRRQKTVVVAASTQGLVCPTRARKARLASSRCI